VPVAVGAAQARGGHWKSFPVVAAEATGAWEERSLVMGWLK
jgi:hypothetical protein